MKNYNSVLYLGILVLFISLVGCKNLKKEKVSAIVSSNKLEDNFNLVFNVAMNEEQTDYDVWHLNLKTKVKTNITKNPKDVAWAYGADNKVLFISDRDTCVRCIYLYEMNPDGTGIRKITDFQLRDSWLSLRKNGTEIILNPSRKVDSAFYIIDRNGKVFDKIYTGLKYANDPCFSPDGNSIAFRGGDQISKRVEGFNEAIYVMDLNTRVKKRITNYPVNDTSAPWYAYKAGVPKWHPTENFISYQSYQNGQYNLFAVTPDGSKQWKLTNNSQAEGYHSWSPDGKWLALEITDSIESNFDIALMNWVTKEIEIFENQEYVFEQGPVFVAIK